MIYSLKVFYFLLVRMLAMTHEGTQIAWTVNILKQYLSEAL